MLRRHAGIDGALMFVPNRRFGAVTASTANRRTSRASTIKRAAGSLVATHGRGATAVGLVQAKRDHQGGDEIDVAASPSAFAGLSLNINSSSLSVKPCARIASAKAPTPSRPPYSLGELVLVQNSERKQYWGPTLRIASMRPPSSVFLKSNSINAPSFATSYICSTVNFPARSKACVAIICCTPWRFDLKTWKTWINLLKII